MVSRKLLAGGTLACLLLALWGVFTFLQQRHAACAYVPLLTENLLPNADMSTPAADSPLPQGWSAAAPGVQVGDFAVDGDGRALQLLGIANYAQTPPVVVRGGGRYCLTARALTDSPHGSATRLRVAFRWLDAQGRLLDAVATPWQPVVLWQAEAPPDDWSHIHASFVAPPGAATLQVRFYPASDDRIYLDALHVRAGGVALASATTAEPPVLPDPATRAASAGSAAVAVQPWPHGAHGAVSFSFDWETAMGGLVHSRSVGDPYADMDPQQRGLRMREGVTTTLSLFRPYGIRATYYATGYNFLLGNTAQVHFMDNPTYTWASTENHWTSDHWATTPWFAPDPYGTVESHPAWYFGDLIPVLQHAGQDIQSHTFSHFYGGLVAPQDWHSDLTTWNQVAALRDVPPARSLAFPWSSSGGMSDASWHALEQAGITSVTRLSEQAQYNLFPVDAQGLVLNPRCRPLPGHERIMACPDFYLTPATVDQALQQIERVREYGGTIDLWSHTEEVVSAEQQAAWARVVQAVASDEMLWVAPLREITTWQRALEAVTIEEMGAASAGERAAQAPLTLQITNGSDHDLEGLTLRLPFKAGTVRVILPETAPSPPMRCGAAAEQCSVDLAAGQVLAVQITPAP